MTPHICSFFFCCCLVYSCLIFLDHLYICIQCADDANVFGDSCFNVSMHILDFE